jgi:hypothetical protein
MKKMLIFFGLILCFNSYSQDKNAIQWQIDSLKVVRQAYEEKIMRIDNGIQLLEEERKRIMSLQIEQSKNKAFFAKLSYDSKLCEQNSEYSYQVGTVSKGDTVELLDYRRNGYYKVKDKFNRIGFIEFSYFENDTIALFFKH